MTARRTIKDSATQQSLFKTDLVTEDNNQPDFAEIFCDGASSGNPGKSGIGIVILPSSKNISKKNNRPVTVSEYIGIATNNIAEYTALIRGLEKAKSLGISKIKIYLDSELIVKQIKGLYKVKSNNLISLWEKAKNILDKFESYKISHIPRERNSEADSLARKAIKDIR